MKIRALQDTDYDQLNHINHQQDFRLSDFKHSVIDKVVVNDHNQIISYGIVKRQAELIILADKSKPLTSRVKAIRELIKIAIFGASRENCQQLHCFVSDPKIAEILKNKFGFIETKDIVLIKDL